MEQDRVKIKTMKIDRDKIWKMFGKKCAYCGCDLETSTGKHMHADHVKPIIRNWWQNDCLFPEDDNEENIFPTCLYCNRYKSSLSLEEFRRWLIDTPRKLAKVTLYRNAVRFGMIEEKKWNGIFYFETFVESYKK